MHCIASESPPPGAPELGQFAKDLMNWPLGTSEQTRRGAGQAAVVSVHCPATSAPCLSFPPPLPHALL